jgi:hypothetical protein
MRKQFPYKMPIWKLIGTFLFFFVGALALAHRSWNNKEGLDMYFVFEFNMSQASAFFTFLAMVSFMFCILSLGFIWSSMRYDRFVVIENGLLKIPKGLSNKNLSVIDLKRVEGLELVQVKSETILVIIADSVRYQVSARWLGDNTIFDVFHDELKDAIERAKNEV